jgi:ribosomal protein S18 acetylase RimI-like enzyme
MTDGCEGSAGLPARARRVAIAAYAAFSHAVEAGGATVLGLAEAPASPMLNRVVGLGVERPATEADLDAALAAIEPGVTFYVAVDPEARPPELGDWLAARGLEPSWGWMAFARDVATVPQAPTELELAEVADADAAAACARVAAAGYGLPEALEPVIAGARDAGWHYWIALEGDVPVATAALFVADGAGYLGLAATLAEHRGKGAQNALLAARIRRAGELGCDVVFTETGEHRDDRPSNSYRNILRAGFRELAVTANWLGRPA